MIARNKSSKNRFLEFLSKYKNGELKAEREESEVKEKKPLDPERKKKRRGYLKLYARRLWPHWRMVSILAVLAVLVSVLEIIQPLFARYIFDDVLLADKETVEKIWDLNVVGFTFILSLIHI